MSAALFQPIQHTQMFISPIDNRLMPRMSCTTTDSSENEAQTPKTHSGRKEYHRRQQSRDKSESPSTVQKDHKNILLRRSSSAMRVRELRDVLAKMASEEAEEVKNEKEVRVTGSQNARLLVASQQCLVSRLQDLKNELESMDNEVSRVRNDIISSRRYFSAMMGYQCGPEWHNARQTDSAYTSPNSASPYSSDTDSPVTGLDSSNSSFQQLRQFNDRCGRSTGGNLARSDSCSSFLSWRSDVEMANLFPNDTSSPQLTPRAEQPTYLEPPAVRISKWD